MGSYGIGISRLVAAIIEAYHDDKGILWPTSIAPFQIGIINLGKNDEECLQASEKIYNELKENNFEIIYDDRDESVGKKYADMDLIGVPFQIIIGSKSEGESLEFKELNSKTQILNLNQIKLKLKS